MVEFIRIEHSFEKAKYYRYSPVENPNALLINGIQLLPNNPFEYRQVTNNKEGVTIEDYQVFVIDKCGNELADITESFNVDEVFQDRNGKNQLYWSLTNIDYDAGGELVMLKIIQGDNETLYSSYFSLTNDKSEYTSRWDYSNNTVMPMLSVQLNMYFRQYVPQTSVETYTTIAEGKIIPQGVIYSQVERWQTDIVDKNFFPLFLRLFTARFVYCDFLRCGIPEAIEVPEIDDVENYYQTNFNITRDEDDVYNPVYIPYIPPTPEPPEMTITLEGLRSLNNKDVEYNFILDNLTASYLTYQYSEDGETNWQDLTISGVSSPKSIPVKDHLTNDFYYRIYSYENRIYSNILQLPERKITITNITAEPPYFNNSGNVYTIFYTVVGYTPSSDLNFEKANNLNLWSKLIYEQGNQNPKQAQTGFSFSEFKKFRIVDPVTGITSNEFNIEL